MCIAIVVPAGKVLPEEHIRTAFTRNKDGGGFAYVRRGRVVVEKGFMEVGPLIDRLRRAQSKNKKSNFIVHMRIATTGFTNRENTHPFSFDHGAMIHNGGIGGTGAKHHEGKSDTCLFVERFGDRLTYDVVKENNEALSKALGWNKLAFLFHSGEYAIINEKEGQWNDGIWYSNGSFRSWSAPSSDVDSRWSMIDD